MRSRRGEEKDVDDERIAMQSRLVIVSRVCPLQSLSIPAVRLRHRTVRGVDLVHLQIFVKAD